MHFHELFGEISLWLGLLLGVALVLLLVIVSATIQKVRQTEGEAGAEGEHASPPIPLVLKMLYVLFGLWALGYTLWVVLSGRPI
ncbi:MAG: hypothetical protein ACYTHM_14270 [Planctomycetota bacterium]